MAERFYVEQPITGRTIVLVGGEAHHLAHVLRAKPGDHVVVFDGYGAEVAAQVAEIKRQTVELTVVERRDADRELPVRLTLGVALPKGERQRWLTEKLVELGAAELVPLVTQRSVAQPTPAVLERLRRCVVEASKQCGRNRLMTISPPRPWDEFLLRADTTALRCLAHPGSPPLALLSSTTPVRPHAILAVGPEGGFTEFEIDLARSAGWQCGSLGSRILRVETAAVALASLIALPAAASQ
jgi:16S rRNA (uracil1498-N3)-methyltransferase